jgi:hypothetical protein
MAGRVCLTNVKVGVARSLSQTCYSTGQPFSHPACHGQAEQADGPLQVSYGHPARHPATVLSNLRRMDGSANGASGIAGNGQAGQQAPQKSAGKSTSRRGSSASAEQDD